MNRPINIALLGATGSIGLSTLKVIRAQPEKYRLSAVGARQNIDSMYVLCREFHPEHVAIVDADRARTLRQRLAAVGECCEVLEGASALCELAKMDSTDTVVAGISGAAGLYSALAAAEAGKRILLANKEALVYAGNLFMETVAANGAELLPLDSEHSAVFQCLGGLSVDDSVKRIILTASGGPFLRYREDQFADITPEQACSHPIWKMGRKISVDSATLMNKGLELIEACWLFGVQQERLDVLIHPQSIIHSLVEYRDNSIRAQMSVPDMCLPISLALNWPETAPAVASPLDLAALGRLELETPDLRRFPCLGLARQAVCAGGEYPLVLNAANEVAVAAFLCNDIGFNSIPKVVEAVLESAEDRVPNSMDEIIERDKRARSKATAVVRQIN